VVAVSAEAASAVAVVVVATLDVVEVSSPDVSSLESLQPVTTAAATAIEPQTASTRRVIETRI
jgi:hypothetical protein